MEAVRGLLGFEIRWLDVEIISKILQSQVLLTSHIGAPLVLPTHMPTT